MAAGGAEEGRRRRRIRTRREAGGSGGGSHGIGRQEGAQEAQVEAGASMRLIRVRQDLGIKEDDVSIRACPDDSLLRVHVERLQHSKRNGDETPRKSVP